MAEQIRCGKCGSLLSKGIPYGLCPKCLMGVALENEPADDSGRVPAAEGPGAVIGRYRLLELLGEGGMGQVYLAEQQEPVQRRVALKIVKLGMDTMQVVSRFRAEQQTLAMLAHPNIAHVFDAGTTESGRPYFVMEYVEGVPITAYCDAKRLSLDERLELFLQVCRAIQHAHQKGVLHRDIKPSNILVSGSDPAPLPKIIDFGIAKAMRPSMTVETAVTEAGQLLGTPEYMSPEQADLACRDVDVRSDVYSLGVVLYELIAGAPPFDGKDLRAGGIDHLRRTIRDNEPKTPSAYLASLGNEAEEVSIMRGTPVLTLIRRLKKELEWIPLKAMRKEPQERYQSVSELSDDVANYLKGEALIAGPQSRVYRTRKFVRRHAALVAMGALVAVSLVSGLIGTTAMYLRADTMRTTALKERRVAEEQSEEYRRLLYIYKVALADAKYRENNLRSAGELLKDCPEDLRNWEWRRLNYVMDESLMTLGPFKVLVPFALSPDGRRLAAAAPNIKIWDAESGAEVLALKGDDKPSLTSLAYSPDGRRIVSGGFDGMVKAWDATSGNEIMMLAGHQGRVMSVALSPDGNRIASGSFDKTIKVWDAATGRELRTLAGHSDLVMSVAFSLDGRRIASGSHDQTVRIWDSETGEPLKIFRVDDQKIIAVAYSPDGRRLAVGGSEGKIKILDADTGQGITVTPGSGWNQSLITSLAFSPDGKRLASGAYDQMVRIWDAATGRELTTLVGHSSEVWSVAFSPDGMRILSSALAPDATIKIWDAGIDRKGTILSGHENRVRHVAFSPDGRQIVSAGMDNTIKVWDVSSAREVRTLRGHERPVWKVVVSPDGRHIVSCSGDGTIRIWDAESGREVNKIPGHEGAVYSVALSPDGTRIASGSVKEVKVWDASTGGELLVLPAQENVHYVAFSPDGKRLAAADGAKAIRVWDASTGKEIKSISGHEGAVVTVLFTPDGKHIVSGAYDGTVRIWDSATGEQLLTLRGHKQTNIESLAISPDGRRIVSGSFAEVKLWDADTGAELMTISARHGALSLAFSPDGKAIACAGGPGPGDPNNITLWQSGPQPPATK